MITFQRIYRYLSTVWYLEIFHMRRLCNYHKWPLYERIFQLYRQLRERIYRQIIISRIGK